MTTTAHKDQFQPEPDLESDCRKARAKALDVCVWVGNGIGDYTTCSHFWSLENIFSPGIAFSFCPFCGKKIKVERVET